MDAARLLLQQQGQPMPRPPCLGALLQLYRARVAIAAGDADAAAADVQALMVGGGNGSSSSGQVGYEGWGGTGRAAAIVAAGHLDLLRGDAEGARRALEAVLSASTAARGDLAPVDGGSSTCACALDAVLLNDLAAVHSACGRPHTAAGAAACATCAVRPHGSGGGGAPLSFPGATAVLYNAGVASLAARDFPGALSCFRRCLDAEAVASSSGVGAGAVAAAAHAPASALASLHGRRCLLELRTAEAAVALYVQQAQQRSRCATRTQRARDGGRLGGSASHGGSDGDTVGAPDASLLADAVAWAESSRTRLQKLQEASTQCAAAGGGGEEAGTGGTAECCGHEWPVLAAAAATMAAHAHLLAGRHADAAEAAHAALHGVEPLGRRGECPPGLPATAACIRAEALHALGRGAAADAALLLAGSGEASTAHSGDSLAGTDADGDGLLGGRAALCANLAASAVCDQDARRASALISEARAAAPASRNVALLSVYVDMMSGRSSAALESLRALGSSRQQ